ncbi:hypothetical protein GLOTRDRAFT_132414 [Gloeophyllum trabeum ATCC 11539]|uniref:BTB domain-containing protein n=1 Tax=Gloeophyllum trabeum (strain ATCC 11539 / FP-39264 / Madison 617) TaxID=670483 RepID=S7PXQ6_GLOTA|nr:uncharacterized protein GLOTRDRAFT_132414 [Gloeophyllum trabeum ATCC 11539]EPQ52298.1 hypothetical protein GLOTRDRAFT_132414 [Gloeophyllum trabeum ATCC 11539]
MHSETKQAVLHSVQKTLLSLHSEVFADMLRLPVPPEAQMYERVPLDQLPDTAEQVETMLDCLYKPNSLHQVMDTTKYAISDIREVAVDKLETQWPIALEEWTALDRHKERLHSERLHALHGTLMTVTILSQIPEVASAIRLARDFDVPSILRATFYEASLINPVHDWDTW